MLGNIGLDPFKKKVGYVEHNSLVQPIFYYPEGMYLKNYVHFLQLVDEFHSHYQKTTFAFFIFHQNRYRDDNKVFSGFFQKLKRRIKAKYRVTKLFYGWAREQTAHYSGLHYHVVIGLNGSLCKSAHTILMMAKELWKEIDQSNTCKALRKNHLYRMIRTPNNVILRAFKMRASYPFKRHTKELVPPYVKKFGFSRFIHPTPLGGRG
ncbi:TPA: inovirus-type Gp2 protein [Vibrio parahaemolyticus]